MTVMSACLSSCVWSCVWVVESSPSSPGVPGVSLALCHTHTHGHKQANHTQAALPNPFGNASWVWFLESFWTSVCRKRCFNISEAVCFYCTMRITTKSGYWTTTVQYKYIDFNNGAWKKRLVTWGSIDWAWWSLT